MDEREFMMAADAELARIETALELASESGVADFDFETKPGGVIEIEFDNGSKIILNRHAAAREIWLADSRLRAIASRCCSTAARA